MPDEHVLAMIELLELEGGEVLRRLRAAATARGFALPRTLARERRAIELERGLSRLAANGSAATATSASRIRSRTVAETLPFSRKARDTADWLTPARAATSWEVMRRAGVTGGRGGGGNVAKDCIRMQFSLASLQLTLERTG